MISALLAMALGRQKWKAMTKRGTFTCVFTPVGIPKN